MKYRLRDLASYLPERVLAYLIPHWRLGLDPDDGWTFWLDASYAKWCRRDQRTTASNQEDSSA